MTELYYVIDDTLKKCYKALSAHGDLNVLEEKDRKYCEKIPLRVKERENVLFAFCFDKEIMEIRPPILSPVYVVPIDSKHRKGLPKSLGEAISTSSIKSESNISFLLQFLCDFPEDRLDSERGFARNVFDGFNFVCECMRKDSSILKTFLFKVLSVLEIVLLSPSAVYEFVSRPSSFRDIVFHTMEAFVNDEYLEIGEIEHRAVVVLIHIVTNLLISSKNSKFFFFREIELVLKFLKTGLFFDPKKKLGDKIIQGCSKIYEIVSSDFHMFPLIDSLSISKNLLEFLRGKNVDKISSGSILKALYCMLKFDGGLVNSLRKTCNIGFFTELLQNHRGGKLEKKFSFDRNSFSNRMENDFIIVSLSAHLLLSMDFMKIRESLLIDSPKGAYIQTDDDNDDE